MTDDELEAIRVRDARWRGSSQLCADPVGVISDRHVLLAEVDRLRAGESGVIATDREQRIAELAAKLALIFDGDTEQPDDYSEEATEIFDHLVQGWLVS